MISGFRSSLSDSWEELSPERSIAAAVSRFRVNLLIYNNSRILSTKNQRPNRCFVFNNSADMTAKTETTT